MKILFFIESLRAGGKERRIVELLKGLKAYPEVEIALVLTREEVHYEEIYKLNIPIHFIKRKYLKKDPLLFLKFYKIVKSFKPDLIHVWGVMVAVYAVPSVAFLKIPLINNMITDTSPKHKWRNKLAFKYSSKVISNSFVGLETYKAPLNKSSVIYNGFNFNRLDKLDNDKDIKEKLGIKTKYVVAMVATFSAHKDYQTYIEAAIEVLNDTTNVTFLCIGEGNDGYYKQMVSSQYSEHILFLGKQSKVESIMNICDIGVLATNIKNHGEGISNALLEFMAIGKPVIATNYGGSVELIQNEKTGFLVEAYSPSSIRNKIIWLMENSDKRTEMGLFAKERIERDFNIERMIDSFYNEYRKVV